MLRPSSLRGLPQQGRKPCWTISPSVVPAGWHKTRQHLPCQRGQLAGWQSSQPVRALAPEKALQQGSPVPSTSGSSPPRAPSPQSLGPATTAGDFGVTASQLQDLVQGAFENSGCFSKGTQHLPTQLRTCTKGGLDGNPAGPLDRLLRHQVFGANTLPQPPAISFWQLVWEALQDRTLVLLMIAGAVSFALAASMPGAESSDWIEGAAILASVLIVVSVSATTNYQKESKFRVLNAIKDNIQVRVIRGGVERVISTHDLLVGDILVVETGDILPADGILVSGEDLRLDESHMTGEAEDVVKSVSTGKTLMLAGSKVREGFGRMLVLAVGERSQQGVLQSMVLAGAGKSVSGSSSSSMSQDADSEDTQGQEGDRPAAQPVVAAAAEETLLTQKLGKLADLIGNAGLGVAGFVTAVSALSYTLHNVLIPNPVPMVETLQAYLDFFITGVTIVVVAVPEGLPLAVTLALAFSVQRMLKDNNLVRHLDACETMASATTICSDKTGTLTANEMCVVRVWAGGEMYGSGPTPPTTEQPNLPTRLTAPHATSSHSASSTNSSHKTSSSSSKDSISGSSVGVSVCPWGSMLPPQLMELLQQSVRLNCTASIQTDPQTGRVDKIGNRTEVALLEWATGHDTTKKDGSLVLQTIPFTSDRKRMSALVVLPETLATLRPRQPVPCRLLIKGAAEVVLDRCNQQVTSDGRVVPLPADTKHHLLEPFTRQGLRVLALAQRDLTLPSHIVSFHTKQSGTKVVPAPGLAMPAATLEDDLVLVGLLGLQDPLRPDVPQAIEQCQRAGIVVRMLTGDNARTAACIATECGILPPATDADAALIASANLVDSLLRNRAAAASAGGVAGTAGALAAAASPPPPAAGPAVSRIPPPPSPALPSIQGSRGLSASAWDMSVDTDSFDFKPKPYRKHGRLSSLDDDMTEDDLYSVGLASRSFDFENKDEWGDDSFGWRVPEELRQQSRQDHKAWIARTGANNNNTQTSSTSSTSSTDNAAATNPATFSPTTATNTSKASRSRASSSDRNNSSYDSSMSRNSNGSGNGSGAGVIGGSSTSSSLGSQDTDIASLARRAVQDVVRKGTSAGASTSATQQQAADSVPSNTVMPSTSEQRVAAAPAAAVAPQGQPAAATQTLSSIATHSGSSLSFTASSASAESSSDSSVSVSVSDAGQQGGVVYSSQSGGSGLVTDSQIQIQSDNSRLLVLEGPQFRRVVQREDGTLDLEALRAVWPRLRVLARCSPADKYLLVTGLKLLRQQSDSTPASTQGTNTGTAEPPFHEIVCMTGDGTNDAPALSAADVGFAMNSGTSIAKDAADILLMDNSFSSIVSAVKWGRNVYASVTKFLQFQLTANVVAVVTAGAGALLVSHSPLSAVQMLWVNLMMDSLASLALATESPTDELLDLPPVAADEPLVTPVVAKHILGQAAAQLVVLASLVLHGKEWLHVGEGALDTIIFNSFVCMQLFNQINCRKVRDEPNVFVGLLSHPTFCVIVGAEAILQYIIVQYGGPAFHTQPLDAAQWGMCVGLGATTLVLRDVLRRVPAVPINVPGITRN